MIIIVYSELFDFYQEFDTLKEAKECIKECEEEDKKNHKYQPNSYEIEVRKYMLVERTRIRHIDNVKCGCTLDAFAEEMEMKYFENKKEILDFLKEYKEELKPKFFPIKPCPYIREYYIEDLAYRESFAIYNWDFDIENKKIINITFNELPEEF